MAIAAACGKREFSVIVERDEAGYYVGSVPQLRGCHSQAKSLDKLMERMKEAIALCLEVEAAGSQATGGTPVPLQFRFTQGCL